MFMQTYSLTTYGRITPSSYSAFIQLETSYIIILVDLLQQNHYLHVNFSPIPIYA